MSAKINVMQSATPTRRFGKVIRKAKGAFLSLKKATRRAIYLTLAVLLVCFFVIESAKEQRDVTDRRNKITDPIELATFDRAHGDLE